MAVRTARKHDALNLLLLLEAQKAKYMNHSIFQLVKVLHINSGWTS